MKKLILIMMAASFFAGCKAGKEDPKQATTPGVGPITVPKERPYDKDERIIGRRICSALKNKRLLFQGLSSSEESFRFRGESNVCNSPFPYGLTEFTAKVSIATTDFQYISTSTRPDYFKDVVTDQNGAMESVCENLRVSDNVSNYTLKDSSYIVVNLLISEGYDRFEVTKLSKNAKGEYKAVSAETVNVVTQTSQSVPKFFGVEKERNLYLLCPNSTDTSYLKQTWLGAITAF